MPVPAPPDEIRRLALVLRHRPELLGLVLDARGWCSVAELLAAFAVRGHGLSPSAARAAIDRGIALLEGGSDFERFDRLGFIVTVAAS